MSRYLQTATEEVVLPEWAEDIKSDLVTDKKTNHPDSINKIVDVLPGKSAGHRCLPVNHVSNLDEDGHVQERAKKKKAVRKY